MNVDATRSRRDASVPGGVQILLHDAELRSTPQADRPRKPLFRNSLTLPLTLDRMQQLRVEARDRDIVVTMPGTSFRGGYRRPDRGRLVVGLDYFQNGQKGPIITRAEFIAQALKLANDKARELGWIVENPPV